VVGVRVGGRAALVGAVVLSLAAGAGVGRAGGIGTAASPYDAGSRGYDISYPNCRRRPALQADFSILGVNGGRPFTFNPCLVRESRWASDGPQAVYLNTGLASVYRKRIAPECAGAGSFARAVGCSEAATSLRRIDEAGLARPDIWWLDVEPSNTWSASRSQNARVLDAMIAYLTSLKPAPLVGIYSKPSWWWRITGGWTTPVPEWIPSRTAVCPAAFSAGPVWLAQLPGVSPLDVDATC
jgi:hypothetical protein